jgi:hypothetical protein
MARMPISLRDHTASSMSPGAADAAADAGDGQDEPGPEKDGPAPCGRDQVRLWTARAAHRRSATARRDRGGRPGYGDEPVAGVGPVDERARRWHQIGATCTACASGTEDQEFAAGEARELEAKGLATTTSGLPAAAASAAPTAEAAIWTSAWLPVTARGAVLLPGGSARSRESESCGRRAGCPAIAAASAGSAGATVSTLAATPAGDDDGFSRRSDDLRSTPAPVASTTRCSVT